MRIALTVLAVIGLAVAALVPVMWTAGLRSDAEAAEVEAAALRTPILAEPGGAVVTVGTPVFRIERAPEALVRPVIDRRLAVELSPVVASWPEPYCLDVHIDGRQVFTAGSEGQIPASVQKLVTAAAVLTAIPADERLITTVLADAPLVDGVIDGNVYVLGGGDPLITTSEYSDAYPRQPQLRTSLETLVDQMVATGVTRITGRLIADETRYDRVRYVETWPERYQVQHNSGPLSALTLNDGFERWDPQRSDAADPSRHFVDRLRLELGERDVFVAGGTASGVAPAGLEVMTEIESPPMVEIVQQMLRESDNNTAELLLKELGRREGGVGSTSVGAAVATRIVSTLFPAETPPVVFDGSGLDRGNVTTCGLLTALLDLFGAGSELGAGLPIANQTGTLAHRFEDDPAAGRLIAKTGLLNNVNGLAGFVVNDGGLVTFAQLLNGLPIEGRLGIDIQEELVAVLLRHPGDLDVSAVTEVLHAQP